MNIQPYWIGYHTITEWSVSIDDQRPVFASLVTEPGRTDPHGVRIDSLVIQVSQPCEDLLHYWRTRVGDLRYLYAEPFDTDHKQRVASAEMAWQSVQDWLKDHNIAWQEAVVAYPRDLRLLDGEPL